MFLRASGPVSRKNQTRAPIADGFGGRGRERSAFPWRTPVRGLLACLRLAVGAALVAVVAAGAAACGDEAAAMQEGILTVVRVEERLPDGSWVPTEGAVVQYQIWAGTTHNSQVSLYHEYQDTTDAQGLSAVNRDPGEKQPGGIGMIFVDVTHPDGRSNFRRAPAEELFDFQDWARQFPSGALEAEDVIDQVCSTAIDFPGCADKLEREGFKTWGVGFVVRLR